MIIVFLCISYFKKCSIIDCTEHLFHISNQSFPIKKVSNSSQALNILFCSSFSMITPKIKGINRKTITESLNSILRVFSVSVLWMSLGWSFYYRPLELATIQVYSMAQFSILPAFTSEKNLCWGSIIFCRSLTNLFTPEHFYQGPWLVRIDLCIIYGKKLG